VCAVEFMEHGRFLRDTRDGGLAAEKNQVGLSRPLERYFVVMRFWVHEISAKLPRCRTQFSMEGTNKRQLNIPRSSHVLLAEGSRLPVSTCTRSWKRSALRPNLVNMEVPAFEFFSPKIQAGVCFARFKGLLEHWRQPHGPFALAAPMQISAGFPWCDNDHQLHNPLPERASPSLNA